MLLGCKESNPSVSLQSYVQIRGDSCSPIKNISMCIHSLAFSKSADVVYVPVALDEKEGFKFVRFALLSLRENYGAVTNTTLMSNLKAVPLEDLSKIAHVCAVPLRVTPAGVEIAGYTYLPQYKNGVLAPGSTDAMTLICCGVKLDDYIAEDFYVVLKSDATLHYIDKNKASLVLSSGLVTNYDTRNLCLAQSIYKIPFNTDSLDLLSAYGSSYNAASRSLILDISDKVGLLVIPDGVADCKLTSESGPSNVSAIKVASSVNSLHFACEFNKLATLAFETNPTLEASLNDILDNKATISNVAEIAYLKLIGTVESRVPLTVHLSRPFLEMRYSFYFRSRCPVNVICRSVGLSFFSFIKHRGRLSHWRPYDIGSADKDKFTEELNNFTLSVSDKLTNNIVVL